MSFKRFKNFSIPEKSESSVLSGGENIPASTAGGERKIIFSPLEIQQT